MSQGSRVGALFPSVNGCAVHGVYWENSLLSPDVKDVSASLLGDTQILCCESGPNNGSQLPAVQTPLVSSELIPCVTHSPTTVFVSVRNLERCSFLLTCLTVCLVNMFAVERSREGTGGHCVDTSLFSPTLVQLCCSAGHALPGHLSAFSKL